MRSVPTIVMLFLLAAAAGPAFASQSPATPAPAATPAGRLASMAPADRYFGPFAMSPLSIRSTIGLLGREYHARTISDHDLLHKAAVTEDALHKWRAAYPADPWLAPTFFHLEQLYQAVQTAESRKHATAVLKAIVFYYPSSKQAHLSRARLAAGFPPLVAETPLVPAAAPAASDSALPATAAQPPAPAPPASPQPASAPNQN